MNVGEHRQIVDTQLDEVSDISEYLNHLGLELQLLKSNAGGLSILQLGETIREIDAVLFVLKTELKHIISMLQGS